MSSDPSTDFISVELGLAEYVEARQAELEQMFIQSSVVHGNARIMQRLPRHMRRRAASHNVKRLPTNIRNIAQREVLHNAPNKGKRPSRKHRRRPRNLLSEYARRQRSHVWLETHIWHAKRFHMAHHWGYRLADFPNDKGWRACQRALTQYCIMWDMSYLCCIEIDGVEEEIIPAMKRLMSEETGLTVGAKTYLDGKREGSTVLYSHDAYPFSAIGPASFLWRPVGDNATTVRRLWLWVHPSCYSRVLEELAIVFQATKVEEEKSVEDTTEQMDTDDQSTPKDSDETVEKSKDKDGAAKSAPMQNPVFKGESVSFRSLKDTLCRYRLLGPKSLSVLQEAFKQPLTDEVDSERTGDKAEKSTYWWQIHNDSARNNDAWKEFEKYSHPSDAPRNSSLGLTVRDPRLFVPQKITNSQQKVESGSPSSEWRSIWSDSPLWEEEIRCKVKDTKMTEHQLNITRSQKLIPGSIPELGASESRIPVLVVQQCGTSHAPYSGTGVDVVVPGGWGMAFWVALVYRGARVGGLKQLQQTDRELARPNFPHDFPDTMAGQQWLEARKQEESDAFHKRPPAKRPNFQKLGTLTHAFGVDWGSLVKGREGEPAGRWFVLRSRRTLAALQRALQEGDASALPSEEAAIDAALIPVRVTTLLKGVPSSKAAICLPTLSDLQSLARDRKFPGPSETIHRESTGTASLCSRTVLGYVSEGDMSLSIGKGQGFGFVSFTALQQVLASQTGKGIKVLVRGVTETVYRFHKIEVVC